MKKIWPLSFAIAHRGASQLAPENTISALKIAKKHGAAWVECDIQLTKDNHPVIFHDTQLNRTTNGHGALSEITFLTLQSLDAGSWFSPEFTHERIPTLQKWLQCAAHLKLKLNLEIKSTTKKKSILFVECVIDQLQKYWSAYSTSIFISSSNLLVLMKMAERVKSLPLGFISEKKFTEQEVIHLFNSNIISVHQPFKMLTEKYVKMLHGIGLRVLAYTVNDFSCAEKLKAMGIDGIFTDNENLFSL